MNAIQPTAQAAHIQSGNRLYASLQELITQRVPSKQGEIRSQELIGLAIANEKSPRDCVNILVPALDLAGLDCSGKVDFSVTNRHTLYDALYEATDGAFSRSFFLPLEQIYLELRTATTAGEDGLQLKFLKVREKLSSAIAEFHITADGEQLSDLPALMNCSRAKTIEVGIPDTTFSTSDPDGIILDLAHLLAAYEIAQSEKSVNALIDYRQVEELRLKFGANAAHSIVLKGVIDSLPEAKARELFFDSFMPDFIPVEVTLFDAWRTGASLQNEVAALHTWIDGREVMIRSSAVFSEDGEQNMGAGIYETVRLPPNATARQLEEAITTVFASVDSERAIKYRQEIGLQQPEKMGLKIQEFVFTQERDPNRDENDIIRLGDGLTTVNSIRPHIPSVVDVFDDAGTHALIAEKLLHDPRLCRARGYNGQFIVAPDLRRVIKVHCISAALIAKRISQLFGRPMQIELANDDVNCRTALLQARPLPASWQTRKGTAWPAVAAAPLWEGQAIGFFDKELKILTPSMFNSEDLRDEEGLVIFNGSYEYAEPHNPEKLFPRAGVVWVMSQRGLSGHLETCALEKGLVLLQGNCSLDAQIEQLESGNSMVQMMSHLAGHTKLRVVANGIRARIYPPEA